MRKEHKNIICDSLNYCVEHKGLEIFAYVIMSSHIHLACRAKYGGLSEIIRDFKKYTSSRLITAYQSYGESRIDRLLDVFQIGDKRQTKKSNHQVWQYNNHAIELYSGKFTLSKINYIHNNPVEAGLVSRPEHYEYSSARDYAGQPGLVKVSLLNLHNLQ